MAADIFQTKFITKCYCINEKNEILILKKGIHEKNGPGSRDLPGGGVEISDKQNNINKLFLNNITREINEECGIILKEETPKIIHQMISEQEDIIKVFQFYTIKFTYTPEVTLSTEHSEYQRISKEKFLKLDFHLSESNYGKHIETLETL